MTSSEDFDIGYEPREGLRNLTHRDADWSGLRILVTGLGISGFAAADALSERGAIVTVVSKDATSAIEERARILEILEVDVRLGPEHLLEAPEDTELIVTSPGFRPDHRLLLAAAARGIPVWGEVELAWRMRAVRRGTLDHHHRNQRQDDDGQDAGRYPACRRPARRECRERGHAAARGGSAPRSV